MRWSNNTRENQSFNRSRFVQANLDAEAKARADADCKLSDRIDCIVSNTNPSAMDSLSEIVSQFSQNGPPKKARPSGLGSRSVSHLEVS